jgi:beta-glucosidase-like glycosyl hydrolase
MSRVILGFRDVEPSPSLREAILAGKVAGLLWFRDALGSSIAEAAERIARTRALWPAGVPCLFAVDEEGGLIQQLCGLADERGVPWPRLPSPRALGRSGDSSLAFAHGREVGRRMRVVGLDVTLAPIVDLDPGPESAVLGTRCFGGDPAEVSRLALSWLRGLGSAGVRGCVKHYPGHGATRADSHHDLPRIDPCADIARHRSPFQEIARRWSLVDGPPPSILTAHVVLGEGRFPVTLDPDALSGAPAGLGPIWTDSLDMGALASFGDLETRARSAIGAGSDLLIVGLDVEEGLALARRLEAPVSDRVVRWMRGGANDRAAIPEVWSADTMARAAGAGLRMIQDLPLHGGEWDWILPERFGPYGSVPEPPQSQSMAAARRRVARVVRYDTSDPGSLRWALERSPHVPALVGWLHRGPAGRETETVIRSGGARVRAVAHLLDGPSEALLPGIWTAETSGFGEGELAALLRIWETGRVDAAGL